MGSYFVDFLRVSPMVLGMGAFCYLWWGFVLVEHRAGLRTAVILAMIIGLGAAHWLSLSLGVTVISLSLFVGLLGAVSMNRHPQCEVNANWVLPPLFILLAAVTIPMFLVPQHPRQLHPLDAYVGVGPKYVKEVRGLRFHIDEDELVRQRLLYPTTGVAITFGAAVAIFVVALPFTLFFGSQPISRAVRTALVVSPFMTFAFVWEAFVVLGGAMFCGYRITRLTPLPFMRASPFCWPLVAAPALFLSTWVADAAVFAFAASLPTPIWLAVGLAYGFSGLVIGLTVGSMIPLNVNPDQILSIVMSHNQSKPGRRTDWRPVIGWAGCNAKNDGLRPESHVACPCPSREHGKDLPMTSFKTFFRRSSERDTFDLPSGTNHRIGLIASPDSTRLAYAVQNWRGSHVEVNGKRLKDYAAVSGISFSPDSRRIAYVAMRRERLFVVVDGTEYEAYDDIGETSPVFSPDSSRVAYGARRGRHWFAVVDGVAIGGPFEAFAPGGIVFSPDSRKVLYVVKRGDSWRAVIDSQEQEPFCGILQKSWCFSPDSKKAAYAAGVNGTRIGNFFVGEFGWVIDGEVQKLWKFDERGNNDRPSSEIYFSPNSTRLAYGVTQNGRFSLVIDGIPQGSYRGLVSGWENTPVWSRFPNFGKALLKSESIVFSADSRHFACAVASDDQDVLIVDGEERMRHEAILNGPVVFSPNSKRLAYGAARGKQQFLVLDGEAMNLYYGLTPTGLKFSPCSKHIAYVASNGPNYCYVIDSSRLRISEEGPVVGAKLVWDDSQHLHTLIARGQNVRILRLDIT